MVVQVFELLPLNFQQQLLLDRDPHGNVQVAKIETERLLLELVEIELAARKQAGRFKGKFSGLTHYMGYEGRASLPTNFDATCAASLKLVITLSLCQMKLILESSSML